MITIIVKLFLCGLRWHLQRLVQELMYVMPRSSNNYEEDLIEHDK